MEGQQSSPLPTPHLLLMQGELNCSSNIFSGETKGRQSLSSCLCCCLFIENQPSINRKDLDNILQMGNDMCKWAQAHTVVEKSNYVTLADLPSVIYLEGGSVTWQSTCNYTTRKKYLEEAIQSSAHMIIHFSKCISLAVIRKKNNFFVFDSYGRDLKGLPDSNGPCTLALFRNAENCQEYIDMSWNIYKQQLLATGECYTIHKISMKISSTVMSNQAPSLNKQQGSCFINMRLQTCAQPKDIMKNKSHKRIQNSEDDCDSNFQSSLPSRKQKKTCIQSVSGHFSTLICSENKQTDQNKDTESSTSYSKSETSATCHCDPDSQMITEIKEEPVSDDVLATNNQSSGSKAIESNFCSHGDDLPGNEMVEVKEEPDNVLADGVALSMTSSQDDQNSQVEMSAPHIKHGLNVRRSLQRTVCALSDVDQVKSNTSSVPNGREKTSTEEGTLTKICLETAGGSSCICIPDVEEKPSTAEKTLMIKECTESVRSSSTCNMSDAKEEPCTANYTSTKECTESGDSTICRCDTPDAEEEPNTADKILTPKGTPSVKSSTCTSSDAKEEPCTAQKNIKEYTKSVEECSGSILDSVTNCQLISDNPNDDKQRMALCFCGMLFSNQKKKDAFHDPIVQHCAEQIVGDEKFLLTYMSEIKYCNINNNNFSVKWCQPYMFQPSHDVANRALPNAIMIGFVSSNWLILQLFETAQLVIKRDNVLSSSFNVFALKPCLGHRVPCMSKTGRHLTSFIFIHESFDTFEKLLKFLKKLTVLIHSAHGGQWCVQPLKFLQIKKISCKGRRHVHTTFSIHSNRYCGGYNLTCSCVHSPLNFCTPIPKDPTYSTKAAEHDSQSLVANAMNISELLKKDAVKVVVQPTNPSKAAEQGHRELHVDHHEVACSTKLTSRRVFGRLELQLLTKILGHISFWGIIDSEDSLRFVVHMDAHTPRYGDVLPESVGTIGKKVKFSWKGPILVALEGLSNGLLKAFMTSSVVVVTTQDITGILAIDFIQNRKAYTVHTLEHKYDTDERMLDCVYRSKTFWEFEAMHHFVSSLLHAKTVSSSSRHYSFCLYTGCPYIAKDMWHGLCDVVCSAKLPGNTDITGLDLLAAVLGHKALGGHIKSRHELQAVMQMEVGLHETHLPPEYVSIQGQKVRFKWQSHEEIYHQDLRRRLMSTFFYCHLSFVILTSPEKTGIIAIDLIHHTVPYTVHFVEGTHGAFQRNEECVYLSKNLCDFNEMHDFVTRIIESENFNSGTSLLFAAGSAVPNEEKKKGKRKESTIKSHDGNSKPAIHTGMHQSQATTVSFANSSNEHVIKIKVQTRTRDGTFPVNAMEMTEKRTKEPQECEKMKGIEETSICQISALQSPFSQDSTETSRDKCLDQPVQPQYETLSWKQSKPDMDQKKLSQSEQKVLSQKQSNAEIDPAVRITCSTSISEIEGSSTLMSAKHYTELPLIDGMFQILPPKSSTTLEANNVTVAANSTCSHKLNSTSKVNPVLKTHVSLFNQHAPKRFEEESVQKDSISKSLIKAIGKRITSETSLEGNSLASDKCVSHTPSIKELSENASNLGRIQIANIPSSSRQTEHLIEKSQKVASTALPVSQLEMRTELKEVNKEASPTQRKQMTPRLPPEHPGLIRRLDNDAVIETSICADPPPEDTEQFHKDTDDIEICDEIENEDTTLSDEAGNEYSDIDKYLDIKDRISVSQMLSYLISMELQPNINHDENFLVSVTELGSALYNNALGNMKDKDSPVVLAHLPRCITVNGNVCKWRILGTALLPWPYDLKKLSETLEASFSHTTCCIVIVSNVWAWAVVKRGDNYYTCTTNSRESPIDLTVDCSIRATANPQVMHKFVYDETACILNLKDRPVNPKNELTSVVSLKLEINRL